MEGVGARLGRSSTRYGPATVFSGPVRKWKKNWVPISSPSNTNNSKNNNNDNNNQSHLLLYKWTPISSQANASSAASGKDAAAAAAPTASPEEPPKRKFRYVPISVIEEQKQDFAAKSDDENKPNDADPSPQPTQADGSDEQPDMNDVSMEEAQASDEARAPRDEANETNLDLSLGLKARDGDREDDSTMVE